MDDVFVINTTRDRELERDARTWIHRLELEWVRMGVQINVQKTVDQVEGAEVLGAAVHPTQHTLAVAMDMVFLLMCALLTLALQWRPSRSAAERLVGKVGHLHGLRPCLRSALSHTTSPLHPHPSLGRPGTCNRCKRRDGRKGINVGERAPLSVL